MLLASSRTLLRAPLPGRYTPVTVHAGLPVGGFLFLWRIPLTVSAEGPGPASGHHQPLQVIFLREALSHRTVGADVVVHLLANDGPAPDEVFERLLCKRARVPLPIIASLAPFRSVDPEQP